MNEIEKNEKNETNIENETGFAKQNYLPPNFIFERRVNFCLQFIMGRCTKEQLSLGLKPDLEICIVVNPSEILKI